MNILNAKREILTMNLWTAQFIFLGSAFVLPTKAGEKGSRTPECNFNLYLHEISKLNAESNVCLTADCVKVGFDLSRSINGTINPCTDFYDYVCKNWEASNPIPSYVPSYGQLGRVIDQLAIDIKGILEGLSSREEDQTLEDKIGLAYKSCMQNGSKVEQMSQLINVLNKFHIYGWPLEKSTNESNSTHWTNIYRKIRIGADLGFIFTLNVETYFLTTSNRPEAITLKYPSFVPSRIQIARYKKENDTAAFAYYEFIRKTVRLFSNSTSNERVSTIAEDIFNFEVQLAKMLEFDFEFPDLNISIYDYANYSYDYYDTQDPTDGAVIGSVDVTTKKPVDEEHNTRYKVNEAWLNSIGWLQLLKDIFQDVSVNLTGEEEMNIFEPSYFQEAMKLINNTPAETLSNYFGWKLLYELGPIASDDMRKLNLEFNHIWKGTEEEEPHWRRCVSAISDPIDPILGYGLGSLYIKKYFNCY
uniref:Putative peptidase family m13 n=1 Tax=Ixodes ricinus TaxID=34613 RepID=V5GMS7_IXORI